MTPVRLGTEAPKGWCFRGAYLAFSEYLGLPFMLPSQSFQYLKLLPSPVEFHPNHPNHPNHPYHWVRSWRTQKCLLLSTCSIYIFNRHHLTSYCPLSRFRQIFQQPFFFLPSIGEMFFGVSYSGRRNVRNVKGCAKCKVQLSAGVSRNWFSAQL